MVFTVNTNTSSEADFTAVNQTSDGSTAQGEVSPSTGDWRALTTDVSRLAENNASTESVSAKNLSNWPFSVPSWILNNSFGDQSLLEEMMKKHKHEMVPPPGKHTCIDPTVYTFLND